MMMCFVFLSETKKYAGSGCNLLLLVHERSLLSADWCPDGDSVLCLFFFQFPADQKALQQALSGTCAKLKKGSGWNLLMCC
jgi:hypothetical protein